MRPDTVVEVWKDQKDMSLTTSKGYRTILASCWYLSNFAFGQDWVPYYKCEPLNFNGKKVLTAGPCLDIKFTLKKMCLKVSSANWQPFCLGLNVLKTGHHDSSPIRIPIKDKKVMVARVFYLYDLIFCTCKMAFLCQFFIFYSFWTNITVYTIP